MKSDYKYRVIYKDNCSVTNEHLCTTKKYAMMKVSRALRQRYDVKIERITEW